MNPEIKIFWIDALVSGEYAMGKEALRNGDTFCPLGVLCDLYRRMHPNAARWVKLAQFDGFEILDGSNHIHDAIPPIEVLIWAGIDKQDCLTIQNLSDGQVGKGVNHRPMGFKRVANWIETYL
jgi:hypothetical protein